MRRRALRALAVACALVSFLSPTRVVGLRGTASGAAFASDDWVVDAFGDSVAVGTRFERIVSLSPNLTEALFALGVDPDRIAGRTIYCDYPPEALARPSMGGIVDPSVEKIFEAHPDLVLLARGNPSELRARLRELDLRTFAVEDRADLAGIRQVLETLTRLVGSDRPARADSLLSRFRTELAGYEQGVAALGSSERPSVFFVDPQNPDWTAGPGSHVDDVIRLAGGRNVVTEGGAWPRISTEIVLRTPPDWLLVAVPRGSSAEAERTALLANPALRRSAARKDRICWVTGDALLRPGPRLLDALEQVAGCLGGARTR